MATSAAVPETHYIRAHFDDIRRYADAIEARLDDDWYTPEDLIRENRRNLELAKKFGVNYVRISDRYEIDFDL